MINVAIRLNKLHLVDHTCPGATFKKFILINHCLLSLRLFDLLQLFAVQSERASDV